MTKSKKKSPNVGAPSKCQSTEISTTGPNKSFKNISNNVTDIANPLQPNFPQEKLDISEIPSGRTNKMGEGKNGPSHCPLPKVVVRTKAKSLK